MAQTSEGAAKAAARHAGLSLEDYQAKRAAGLKRCRTCKQWKQLADFVLDASRIDGRFTVCQFCRRVPFDKRTLRRGQPSPFCGKTHTLEARQIMSERRRGNQNRKGKPCTPEQIEHIREGTRRNTPRGAAHPRFIDGRAWERANRGLAPEDCAWREAVYARDDYRCIRCGDDQGGNLNAHHVEPWATCPDRRHDVGNGITLCKPCHEIEHYGRTVS